LGLKTDVSKFLFGTFEINIVSLHPFCLKNNTRMTKNLLIVESPAKAKTIEKYLGKGFIVKSSYGHIRDLPSKDLSIDVENNFEPKYVIPADKKKLVAELKKLAKAAEEVWLATDEDREGEAISWHLCEALGLDPTQTKRIVFHEITKTAIQDAVQNPRQLNQNLVNAQQARRVIDRLVGYKLSPVLWKKIRPSLSAGRVQSVAVRLIVERENSIEAFVPKVSYRVTANFTLDNKGKKYNLKAELDQKFETEEEANKFLQDVQKSDFNVGDIQVKPSKRNPSAPFTTSTLQQDAARKFGYSVIKTMLLAQKLYESGKITYMRTDSVNLSETAITAAEESIKKNYGDKYSNPKRYKGKNANAQEAHEAIRPSDMTVEEVAGDDDAQRLYSLIWKRAVASQMAPAELENTTVRINVSGRSEQFVAKGQVIKFDGFLKLYLESTDEEEEEGTDGLLPPMEIEMPLTREDVTATQRFSRAPARYNEAALVKKLEELGIGRPSTYAPTITTIQKRNYVEKKGSEGHPRDFIQFTLDADGVRREELTENTGVEKNKLYPTDIGGVVNDFLVQNFEHILDYGFTASLEEMFDDVARGDAKWQDIISALYDPLEKDVQETLENAERASGERELGNHPESGLRVSTRIGRYGPMVQIDAPEGDEEAKPKFAKLREGQSIKTVTMEDALELFKLPRILGEYEGDELHVAIGRFGPYVRNNKKFYSLGKELDPYTVTADQCIELIKIKKEEEKNKMINEFDDIQVLNGRYGPYIKQGKTNYKIPKDKDPAALTKEDCEELIKNAPPKKGRGRAKAKK